MSRLSRAGVSRPAAQGAGAQRPTAQCPAVQRRPDRRPNRCTNRRPVRSAAAVLAVSGALFALMPLADARPLRPGETVLDRPRPEVTEHGGRLGRLWVRPTLTSALSFHDNVFANDAERVSDLLLRTAPAIVAETDWRGHQASFSASAEHGAYLEQRDESYLDLNAQAYGRVQATRRIHGSALVRWHRGHVPRRSTESPVDAREPTVTRGHDGEIRLVHTHDGDRLAARLAARSLDYDDVVARDGTTINNDDRDRWVSELEVEVRTRMALRVDLFTRGRFNFRRYVDRVDDQGYRRDSDGQATVAGVTWRPTGLTTLEAYGGVRQQIYADPRFDRLRLPTAGFEVTTSPSELTTIRLSLDQLVRETTEPAASGRLVTALRARVDHELRRDLLAALTGRYARDDYRGIDRRDVHVSAGLDLTYLASRHVHARLSLQHSRRHSDDPQARTYHGNRVELAVELRY